MPTVSIILPTHNGSRYLRQALESCLAQTFTHLELIVVDDGSTDDTESVLAGFADPRLQVVRNRTNLGLPESLNIGFAHAKGEYLTWTSDDNYYAKSAIATMVDALRTRSDIDFVYAPFWEVDPAGNITALHPCGQPETIMMGNPVGACFLYTRRVYEAVGDYDPTTRWFEDYNYWLRVSQNFKMCRLEEPLYYYRMHSDSLTGRPGLAFQRSRQVLRMLKQRFGLPWASYWRQMAAIDIEEAFAAYRDRAFSRVPILAMRGVLRNPLWLKNLGVTSITLRSVLATLRRSGWSGPGSG